MRASSVLGGRGRGLFAALLTLSLGLPALALGAVEVTNLGPLTYMRSPGKPPINRNGFPGTPGRGVMHIVDTRASLAVILLNGRLVGLPRSLDPRANSFDVPVPLVEKNQLEVALFGKPGSSLTLRVTQMVEAQGAAVIGRQGGIVEVRDATSSLFGTSLVVPAGALPDATVLRITAAPDAPAFRDGSAGIRPLAIEPSGVAFSTPARLTVPYDDNDLDPDVTLGATSLSAYTFDNAIQEWTSLSSIAVDTTAKRVGADLSHLSYFTLRDDTVTGGPSDVSTSEYLPVLLVHGLQPTSGVGGLINCTRGTSHDWGNLPGLLVAQGLDVFVMNYNTELRIQENGAILRSAIDNVLMRVQHPDGSHPAAVTLIAHSMGGLVARYAIERETICIGRCTGEKIYTLTTVATPHMGAGIAAYPSACESVPQLQKCSQFLEDTNNGLNALLRRAGGVPNLLSPSVDYRLYAAHNDHIVSIGSALGNGECGASSSIYESPAIDAASRGIKEEVGLYQEVYQGCGPTGDSWCDHITYTPDAALPQFVPWGVVDVQSEFHTMWPRLRNVAKGARWFAEGQPDPNSGGPGPVGSISEFPLPTAAAYPLQIAPGPDGNLWFTEHAGDRVGRITVSGEFKEFQLPTTGASSAGITTGPDGNLWFTESNVIGRITPSGVITEFPLPTANVGPWGIAAGPDGNLWFTEVLGDQVGRITPSGVITEFSLPASPAAPYGLQAFAIAAGPDGNLWVTECLGNSIVQITPAGAITGFQLPTPAACPLGITAGPDGNLWFVENYGNKIGRITPSGEITEFPQPPASAGLTSAAGLWGITAGPDGNLWFTESEAGGNRIGRITPYGEITEFPQLPTANAGPYGIAAGPDGSMWFAEYRDNQIGRIKATPTP